MESRIYAILIPNLVVILIWVQFPSKVLKLILSTKVIVHLTPWRRILPLSSTLRFMNKEKINKYQNHLTKAFLHLILCYTLVCYRLNFLCYQQSYILCKFIILQAIPLKKNLPVLLCANICSGEKREQVKKWSKICGHELV